LEQCSNSVKNADRHLGVESSFSLSLSIKPRGAEEAGNAADNVLGAEVETGLKDDIEPFNSRINTDTNLSRLARRLNNNNDYCNYNNYNRNSYNNNVRQCKPIKI